MGMRSLATMPVGMETAAGICMAFEKTERIQIMF
jgi:hypothetical protein